MRTGKPGHCHPRWDIQCADLVLGLDLDEDPSGCAEWKRRQNSLKFGESRFVRTNEELNPVLVIRFIRLVT